MIDSKDVQKLGELARIGVSKQEEESFGSQIDSILSYVAQIKEVSSEDKLSFSHQRRVNVLRDDEEPHESGVFTEKLLQEAPAQKDGYVVVKKILPHD